MNYYCEEGMTSSVVRMLEMRSIDVEAKGGVEGRTCLTTAAAHGYLDICRLLIDRGARLDVKDRNGNTPLYYAAAQGRVEIVRLLCDRGADIEARINHGWRPLHYAVMFGQISVIKELVEERNAEINARDDDGRTALWLANYVTHISIAAYLVSHGGID